MNKKNIINLMILKIRIEQAGLLLSLTGLASILQPMNFTLYSYGFYILFIGAALTFIGSAIPEAKRNQALLQAGIIVAIMIIIILISIFLAPKLVV